MDSHRQLTLVLHQVIHGYRARVIFPMTRPTIQGQRITHGQGMAKPSFASSLAIRSPCWPDLALAAEKEGTPAVAAGNKRLLRVRPDWDRALVKGIGRLDWLLNQGELDVVGQGVRVRAMAGLPWRGPVQKPL